MRIGSKIAMSPVPTRRFWLRGLLGMAAFMLVPRPAAFAQGTTTIHPGGGGKGAGGKGGGESGGGESGGGESGGGHGAGESGGGKGGDNPQDRTPAQRAMRHRERKGRTLGGGESTGGGTGGGGHTGGGSHSGDEGGTGTTTLAPQVPSDGSITGPIGGSNGGEHFVHPGIGGWGADTKVLRQP